MKPQATNASINIGVLVLKTTASDAGMTAYSNMMGKTAAFFIAADRFESAGRTRRAYTRLCRCRRSG